MEAVTTPDFKKEFPRNLNSNIALFIINFAVGLLIVPFYIDTLGLAAYGIIPLATSFTSYVLLILDSLNAAISRFIVVHIHRSDYNGVAKIFNTALFAMAFLVLVFTPVAIAVAWFAPDFFHIMDVERGDVFFLFALIFASALITSLRSPFSAVLTAFNKIHINNYVSILYTLLSIGLIITFFLIETPSIIYVGVAYLVSATLAFILSIYLSRKVYYKIELSLTHFSKDHLSEMANLAKWILVDQIGTLLLLQLSLIIVNRDFGTESGGEYAIVMMLFNAIWAITGLITSVLSPMFYTYYARGNFDDMRELSRVSVKFIGLTLALPIALVCIFSSQILTIWVGEEFIGLSPLVWILLIPLTPIMAARPLILSYAAYNKVRMPALVTIVAGGANMILALTLPEAMGLGIYGVALAFIVVLWIRNVAFVPWYAAKIQGVDSIEFIRPMVPGIVGFIALLLIGFAIQYIVTIPASILGISLISILISIMFVAIVTRLVLNERDRKLIRSILPSFISGRVPSWLL